MWNLVSDGSLYAANLTRSCTHSNDNSNYLLYEHSDVCIYQHSITDACAGSCLTSLDPPLR